MEQIIGIDLAKRVFQVHIVSTEGEKQANKMITREKLMTFIAQQPASRIVMEACGSANYWSRQFKQYGHEVKQISPQYVAPFRMGNKNDRNDAVAIVEAASRPGMRYVPEKTVEQQDIQCLHRVRQRLMKNRTALINQVRGPRIQIITATPMVHRREEANCRFWYASSRQRNKAEHHEIPAVDRRTTIPDRLPS